jgi:hypothetical protein
MRRIATVSGALVTAVACLATMSPAAQAVIAGAMPVPLISAPKAAQPPALGRIPAAPGFAPMVGQRLCDPVAKPGVAKFASLVLATYPGGRNGGIVRSCSIGASSEHKEGRAWDWMINMSDPRQAAAAANAVNWLMAAGPDGKPAWQARRLGVMYVVYNRKIWSASRANEGWRPYSGASNHTDHVHFSFSWAGAMGATEFWTGKVTPTSFGPCPSWNNTTCARVAAAAPAVAKSASRTALVQQFESQVDLTVGSRGPAVVALQTLLGMPQEDRDGIFGPRTERALLGFKRDSSLSPTNVVNARTWEALQYPYPPAR